MAKKKHYGNYLPDLGASSLAKVKEMEVMDIRIRMVEEHLQNLKSQRASQNFQFDTLIQYRYSPSEILQARIEAGEILAIHHAPREGLFPIGSAISDN